MGDAPDRELIRAYLNGDKSAFTILYNRYKQSLYRFLVFYLGSESRAEDVFQRTFMKFFERVSKAWISERMNFKGWVFKVAVNMCRDEFRRDSVRRKRVPLLAPGEGADTISYWEERQERERISGKVSRAVRALPDKFRKVIGLYYYSGLPYAGIAGVLKIPLGTVKSRMNTGLKILEERLKGESDDEKT